ncbi:MAG: carbohydrate kinase family protein, partial [Chloroflexi bacterium]|nr:carbohydrate kinase family protein [Chloroflexota bacterium]
MTERSDITQPQAQVVCFGMITAGVVLAVDRPPVHNTVQLVSHRAEFISDDAALVACALRQWDVSTALIGTAVGDDAAGRRIADQLKSLGVIGDVRLSSSITTPLEVNVSDPTGARTFFWQRDPAILDTLNTADLSSIKGSKLLYVDWYDGDRILRPMEEAARLGIPVFLNLEHGHQDNDILDRYASHATICQAVVDEAQRGNDEEAVIARLLEAGVQTALVTLGDRGSLVADQQGQVRLAVGGERQVRHRCGVTQLHRGGTQSVPNGRGRACHGGASRPLTVRLLLSDRSDDTVAEGAYGGHGLLPLHDAVARATDRDELRTGYPVRELPAQLIGHLGIRIAMNPKSRYVDTAQPGSQVRVYVRSLVPQLADGIGNSVRPAQSVRQLLALPVALIPH